MYIFFNIYLSTNYSLLQEEQEQIPGLQSLHEHAQEEHEEQELQIQPSAVIFSCILFLYLGVIFWLYLKHCSISFLLTIILSPNIFGRKYLKMVLLFNFY